MTFDDWWNCFDKNSKPNEWYAHEIASRAWEASRLNMQAEIKEILNLFGVNCGRFPNKEDLYMIIKSLLAIEKANIKKE